MVVSTTPPPTQLEGSAVYEVRHLSPCIFNLKSRIVKRIQFLKQIPSNE